MDTPEPRPPTSRQERLAAARRKRELRDAIADRLARDHDGVVTRQMLLAEGLTRAEIRGEVERGAWQVAGWHTLSIAGREPTGRGLWWRAPWEPGERAALDGVTSLLATGLSGWQEGVLHVSVPIDAKLRPLPGVRHHRVRVLGDVVGGRLRRTRADVAVIRAAQWANTERQASTLVAMAVQQHLVSPGDVLARWEQVRHTARRTLLDAVIADVCAGAHSMAELDFARLCRERGLPEPSRQAMRTGPNGRVYLDVFWDRLGVHVEIQGVQHQQGDAVIRDALRLNHLALDGVATTLQIPVLGLRTQPDAFLDQVERAIRQAEARLAA